jgi:hypothetical protein
MLNGGVVLRRELDDAGGRSGQLQDGGDVFDHDFGLGGEEGFRRCFVALDVVFMGHGASLVSGEKLLPGRGCKKKRGIAGTGEFPLNCVAEQSIADRIR